MKFQVYMKSGAPVRLYGPDGTTTVAHAVRVTSAPGILRLLRRARVASCRITAKAEAGSDFDVIELEDCP